MDRLTENDRGTFLVTTRSGTQHVWVITDSGVEVTRKAKRGAEHHWSMRDFPEKPYTATVQIWPEVGVCFQNIINGGHGDIPWTRSSTVQSIERLAA
jgi:hypothetical protein